MATKIRVLRWERGLTTMELARQTGLAQMSISGAETNHRKVSDKTQYILSKFYGIPEKELFNGNKAREVDE